MCYGLFFSDIHGSEVYLDRILEEAEKHNVDYLFNAGDLGHHFHKTFAEKTKDYTVFNLKGNHDSERGLEWLINHYDHMVYLKDGIFKLENTYFVCKSLSKLGYIHMGRRYRKKLRKMLEEVKDEERVILFTHYNKLKKAQSEGILNIHGHKHINKAWMYLWSGKHCDMEKLENYYHKDTTYAHNVALRIYLVNLDTLEAEYLL